MKSDMQSAPVSMRWLWAGRIMSALPAFFLLVDRVILPLGVVLRAGTIHYFIPRTAILSAILLTGYLGGAVATHVRAGHGAVEIFFPVVFGALLWGGLYLCDGRLRDLILPRALPHPITYA